MDVPREEATEVEVNVYRRDAAHTEGVIDLPHIMGNTSLGEESESHHADLKSTQEESTEKLDQAVAIRTQVEYYFSDVNLATDRFLRGKMNRNDNDPVPLKLICTFKKMRAFQPFSAVVDALRTSHTLDIVCVKGEECVVRKVPFIKEKTPKTAETKPTGFEENWTDPPITPDEFAEEQDLYDPDRIFAERIEIAIQRFRAKRRFNPQTADIFTKWMKFGGIETGPKQFSGGTNQEMLEKTSAIEIATIKATEYVGEDKYDIGEDSKWTVDFEAVAKGFLSSILPRFYDLRIGSKTKECVNVLRNFYNYLLYHNVCPEYNTSIYAAREVCNLADRELMASINVMELFPGSFNMACSTLFGGQYQGMYAGHQEWNKHSPAPEHMIGMSDGDARQVLKLALASNFKHDVFTADQFSYLACGVLAKYISMTDILYAPLKQHIDQAILHTERRAGLEVTGIEMPDCEMRGIYERSEYKHFEVPGRLHCKPWSAPVFESNNLPPGYEDPARPSSYIFLVDAKALDKCFIGMKMEASIHTLHGGIKFFDNVAGVYCSFYTFLENELLRKWREPRMLTREEQLRKDENDHSDENMGPTAEAI